MAHTLQWARANNCSTGSTLHDSWTIGRQRPLRQLECVAARARANRSRWMVAVNPYMFYEGRQLHHHRVFSHFLPWRGSWPSTGLVDFLGVRVEDAPHTYCSWAYSRQRRAYANRVAVCDLFHVLQPNVEVQLTWPVISEEYFEYVDVLTAVLEYVQGAATPAAGGQHILPPARARPFSFVELGAGYGHWSLAASQALDQLAPASPRHLVLVDVVAGLERVIRRLCVLNGVAEQSLHWQTGYVAGSRILNQAELANGRVNAFRYNGVWGTSAQGNMSIPALTLADLFRQHHVPCIVDMVDIDIQGAEYARGSSGLLSSHTVTLLTKRVRRVHIGLHGSDADDAVLMRTFVSDGWRVEWYFPGGGRVKNTSWGPVLFADGVLSLVNLNSNIGSFCSQRG